MHPVLTPSPIPRILVAEDEPEIRRFLEAALRGLGYAANFAEEGEEALACLRHKPYSLVLLDLMRGKDGLETLRKIRASDPLIPIVILSSASSPAYVVEAVKNGATDFLSTPVNSDELSNALRRALPATAPKPVPACANSAVVGAEAWPTSTSWSRKVDFFLTQVGCSEVPVLMLGETGVGKEILSRQIHARSPRAHKPFLKLNCAALPPELVESELFGYERGAFTGAFRSNAGKFEMADGGTIFLDEIGDMDLKLQAKLLQVLQDGEFHRLGSRQASRVDVRVIAATHRDLEEAILDGTFRQDLYYRLNVIRVEIPPLRERQDEIIALADVFVKKHASPGSPPMEITPGLRQALLEHGWPGNIRELENAIRKLLVVQRPESIVEDLRLAAAKRDRLTAARNLAQSRPHLIPQLVEEPRWESAPPLSASILRQVDHARRDAERKAILDTLQATRWNRKRAAALLNIEYKALLYRMRKLGIAEEKRAEEKRAV